MCIHMHNDQAFKHFEFIYFVCVCVCVRARARAVKHDLPVKHALLYGTMRTGKWFADVSFIWRHHVTVTIV